MTMRDKDVHLHTHLSDQDLLLFADGELSVHSANRMREHLAACWTCRARATELEGAIADFVQIHQSRVDARMPPAAGLRASLRAQLAVAAATAHKSRFRLFSGVFSRQVALACVALLIVAAGVWRMRSGGFRSMGGAFQVQARALPDRTLTPGFTRDVKQADLCGRQHADAPPAVDISTEQIVFKEYGLPVSASKAYELDYLITPELGGANDVRNLWPEPYTSTAWNAHVKDELENRLHEMVCDGQIDLSTAQNEIAADWIAAYKLHFHTDSPLPNPENTTASRIKHASAWLVALQLPRLSVFGLRPASNR
jgi:hypothetical protein